MASLLVPTLVRLRLLEDMEVGVVQNLERRAKARGRGFLLLASLCVLP